MHKVFHRLSKRSSLLLEVLIALAIVALVALPLIYPHVAILREQRRFLNTIKLDHVANLAYADIIARMYRGDIDWHSLQHNKTFQIDQQMLDRIYPDQDFPFRGYYQFKIGRTKPRKPQKKTFNLAELTLEFIPKSIAEAASEEEKKKHRTLFNYKIYVEREHLQESQNAGK